MNLLVVAMFCYSFSMFFLCFFFVFAYLLLARCCSVSRSDLLLRADSEPLKLHMETAVWADRLPREKHQTRLQFSEAAVFSAACETWRRLGVFVGLMVIGWVVVFFCVCLFRRKWLLSELLWRGSDSKDWKFFEFFQELDAFFEQIAWKKK